MTASGGPWTYTWTPGPALANLYALYPSLGDVTIATNTNLVTTEDGPVQVVRYENLTVNAKLSTTKRCRGLLLLYRDINIGSAGDISMTGRGAKGHGGWTADDLTMPVSVTISGKYGSARTVLKLIREQGWFIGDPNLWKNPPAALAAYGVMATINKGSVLVSSSGCGVGAAGVYNASTGQVGTTGGAGTSAPGGGGSGGMEAQSPLSYSGYGGDAYPWGGGPGGGGGLAVSSMLGAKGAIGGQPYCGKGGYYYGAGAGNPAGNGSDSGVGGILIGIGTGNATLVSGAVVEADGMPGVGCGASSGGGRALLVCGGTLSNSGTIRANGGSTSGSYHGGVGGAGAADTSTFSAMGWT